MLVPNATAQLLLELVGVFVFGLTGGLVGVRRRMDLFAVLVLAVFAGLGGGVVRDVLLGASPPLALRTWMPLAAAGLGGLVTFVAHPRVERIAATIRVLDAAGAAAFSVTGTVAALTAGVPPVGSALLGLTSAIGGGVLRDVLAREVPAVLAQRELYAVPALSAAVIVVVAWSSGEYSTVVALAAAGFAFAFRMVALWRGWRLPAAAPDPAGPAP